MKYSVIIPVYNRPQEVRELLDSLTNQSQKNFEVILVEDGSTEKCDDLLNSSPLDIKYYYKSNGGPADARNYGMSKASGDFMIFFDSDCVIPSGYFEALDQGIDSQGLDAFGGPDMAHSDFTDIQKAINYSMTSFFTTGGIRGASEKLEKFHPRSFNMGYSRAVYEATGGFSNIRFGEDIDMSIRIIESGFKTGLIRDAAVFHKRRTNLSQFFKQVFNSGIARINLYKRHPNSLKLVHLAPSVFTLGVLTLVISSFIIRAELIYPLLLFSVLILLDSSIRNKSLAVGTLSVLTSFVQLISYGTGFLISVWRRLVLKQGEFAAYQRTFYK